MAVARGVGTLVKNQAHAIMGKEGEIGGRLFFTNLRRSLVDEDEIILTSVGVDIGSSTSHLAFSCITLERVDARYIVAARKVLFESDILLTPYVGTDEIDTDKLGAFFETQYRLSGIAFNDIDTGALILTGTAVRRRNARAIGDLFSDAAGKFVSVSAGDEMEAVLAAFGSGAVAKSNSSGREVLNLDIGGGTTKIARCADGAVVDLTAIDIGARVLAFDRDGNLTRIEPAGRRFAEECGIPVVLGRSLSDASLDAIATRMADRVMETLGEQPLSDATRALLRLDPLAVRNPPAIVTFSGGVSEYIYNRETKGFGDLGTRLARAIAARIKAWGPDIQASTQGIRATVIGASQYTIQVSGSTIFISQVDILPLRNVPVIKPKVSMEAEEPDVGVIAASVRASIARLGSHGEKATVALCYGWTQSASFKRIDAFCRGIAAALSAQITNSQPLILIGDGDIGGLIGLHFAEELKLEIPIVSVDGIALQEFDFVDIGVIMDGSGSVPVIIKSLIFPGADTLGKVSDGTEELL